jgi:hypothetical protein
MDGDVILRLLVALLALWAALIVVLWLVRPRNVRLTERVRVAPDLARLVRGLLRKSFSAPGRGRCRVSNDQSRISASRRVVRESADAARILEAERLVELLEEVDQLAHRLTAHSLGPLSLNLLHEPTRGLVNPPSFLGSAHDQSPPVARIRHSLKELMFLEIVDEIAHGLLRRADLFRELRHPAALGWEPLEDRVVGRPDFGQSRGREPSLDASLELMVRKGEQGADQGGAIGLFCSHICSIDKGLDDYRQGALRSPSSVSAEVFPDDRENRTVPVPQPSLSRGG